MCLCALPNGRLNFTTLSLFVSLNLPVCISLSHTLLSLLLLADQQQAEADWEGVQSEACQICPGNQFSLLPFHFIFLFFYSTMWWNRQNVLMGERWWHTHTHTHCKLPWPFLLSTCARAQMYEKVHAEHSCQCQSTKVHIRVKFVKLCYLTFISPSFIPVSKVRAFLSGFKFTHNSSPYLC